MPFHMRSLAGLLSVVFLAGTVELARGQSLGEVAKKEEERRKAVKEPSKVYTNKDLTAVPPPTGASAAEPAVAADPAAAAAAKDKAEADKAKTAESDKTTKPKDQKHWADRMKELRSQLDRDQTYAEGLQSRINALTADFAARDDPAQRAQVSRDRQKALDELNRLKLTIETHKKAIADLEEEARKAGVPSGWLRS